MTEPIDHAAEARAALDRWKPPQYEYFTDAPNPKIERDHLAQAAVHAQLALVAAQDRANELKRIEILVALSRVECENVSTPTDALDALYSRHGNGISEPKVLRTRPSIASSLGLGGESDGE